MPKRRKKIKHFDFESGRIIARKFKIVRRLGAGWQGEVFKIREIGTNIERAAKIFFPHRNLRNKESDIFARKLHALRECPVVIQYHTQETIQYKRLPVTVLISEYVEGLLLSEYLAGMPGKRLPIFQGIHLLHALAVGLQSIHNCGEYHGDMHAGNIIVRRLGLSFELKFLDLFHWGRARRQNMNDDLVEVIRLFYDAIGGRARYSKQPPEIKDICCGLKRSLILKKFRTAAALRHHIETQPWS